MGHAINVDETLARQDVLDLGAAKAGRQVVEQRDFAAGAGRKVAMAAL